MSQHDEPSTWGTTPGGTVSLAPGETLADYAFRVTRERDELRDAVSQTWRTSDNPQRLCVNLIRAYKSDSEDVDAGADPEADPSTIVGGQLRRDRDEARAELAKTESARQFAAGQLSSVHDELEAALRDHRHTKYVLSKERDTLRALLRELTWAPLPTLHSGSWQRDRVRYCICCGRTESEGHNAICRLDAALKEA